MIPENYNSKALVEMWGDFISWEKRRRGENGFIANELKKFGCKTIFDSCLGDGADSIYLLKNKFNVTSNDIDELFIKKAKENAEHYELSLNITSFDWRELEKHFPPARFDAVTCLGNSITYLFDRKDQQKTIQNFKHILKTGGILMIDERNYQYILDNKKEILGDGKFRYSGRYVYCGDKVHGKPIVITPENVRMEYIDETTGNKGYLNLYPFKKGELLELLQDSGFKEIETYSDYQKPVDDNADFYQYICIK